ncbi:Pex12 amino terminal region-domain-containing protein [Melampsora americana]|nr:Pex12 amino terminal region-domain-containing protein [Melampsora americana]
MENEEKPSKSNKMAQITQSIENNNNHNEDTNDSSQDQSSSRIASPENMISAWNRAIRFPNAGQPEIIRADQKDAYFISTLQDMLESSIRGIVGARWLTSHSNGIRDAVHLFYHVLTTLRASQTLGEEYCGIVQVDAATGRFPSWKRRALCILTNIYAPKLMSALYARIRSRLTSVDDRESDIIEDSNLSGQSSYDRAKMFLLDWTSWLPNTLDLRTYHTISSLHLAIFYLTGRYFHLSNRLTGIRYISTQIRRDQNGNRVQPPSYEFLGLLIVIQLVVKSSVWLRNAQRRREAELSIKEPVSNEQEKQIATEPSNRPPTVDGIPINDILFEPDEDDDDQEKSDSKRTEVFVEGVEMDPNRDESSTSSRCTLCLGPRLDQSSLECGHVFCWRCILGWVREKPECPLCRQTVKINELLPLYNF